MPEQLTRTWPGAFDIRQPRRFAHVHSAERQLLTKNHPAARGVVGWRGAPAARRSPGARVLPLRCYVALRTLRVSEPSTARCGHLPRSPHARPHAAAMAAAPRLHTAARRCRPEVLLLLRLSLVCPLRCQLGAAATARVAFSTSCWELPELRRSARACAHAVLVASPRPPVPGPRAPSASRRCLPFPEDMHLFAPGSLAAPEPRWSSALDLDPILRSAAFARSSGPSAGPRTHSPARARRPRAGRSPPRLRRDGAATAPRGTRRGPRLHEGSARRPHECDACTFLSSRFTILSTSLPV